MLDKSVLQGNLFTIFSSTHDASEAAMLIASAIDEYVKMATVNTTVTGTSASGGPVQGVGIGTLT